MPVPEFAEGRSGNSATGDIRARSGAAFAGADVDGSSGLRAARLRNRFIKNLTAQLRARAQNPRIEACQRQGEARDRKAIGVPGPESRKRHKTLGLVFIVLKPEFLNRNVLLRNAPSAGQGFPHEGRCQRTLLRILETGMVPPSLAWMTCRAGWKPSSLRTMLWMPEGTSTRAGACCPVSLPSSQISAPSGKELIWAQAMCPFF